MKLLQRLCIKCQMAHNWPPFGPARAHRFFEKGVLKFVLLDLLRAKPAHGYELIKALEERSGGFYTPSPGSIYPILQQLQEKGYVESTESESRKTYTITDIGLDYLKEHADIIDGLNQFAAHKAHHFKQGEWRETIDEVHRLRQLFALKVSKLNPNQMTKIRSTINQACRDVEAVITKPE